MYLIKNDYLPKIQIVNLNQIIQDNNDILTKCELTAQEECIGHLIQKYNVDEEFDDTSIWSISTTYNAGARVYLDADDYSPTIVYGIDSIALVGGNVYVCNTASTTGAWNLSKWDLVGKQNTIYYAKNPQPAFNIYKYYRKDDLVFYKNKVYTCLIETKTINHNTEIQYVKYEDVPLENVFPDDIVNGHIFWHPADEYYTVSGAVIADPAYWTKGDNRNQFMLSTMINVVLFYAHQAIAPRNIPQRVIDNYTKSLMDLQGAAKGEFTFRLPLIQPKAGSRIRYGGNIRNINSY